MEILILTPKGETVKMSTRKRESVIDLKKRISERLFMAPDLQRILFFHGRVLDDENSLDQLAIEDKSVITLVEGLRGSGIRIILKMIGCDTMDMEIDPTESVFNLKKKIDEKLTKGHDDLRLYCNGERLNSEGKVEDYPITHGSVIHVVLIVRGGPLVYVDSFDGGKRVALECKRKDTILDLKRQISGNYSIVPDLQILNFQGVILDDDEKNLDDYGISHESVIKLAEATSKQIFIWKPDGRTFKQEIGGARTVRELKKKIYRIFLITLDLQILNFQGVTLDDDEKNVDDYGISHESVIDLTEVERQIIIRTSDGGTFKQEMSGIRNVRYLKKKIAIHLSLTMEELNLVFQDIVLEDHTMIEKLNILEDSVIDVHIKKRISFEKDGKEIFVLVGLEEKVSDIKRKICEKAKSSSTDVQLCYKGGRRLEDDKTLLDYKIEDTSQIRVLFLW